MRSDFCSLELVLALALSECGVAARLERSTRYRDRVPADPGSAEGVPMMVKPALINGTALRIVAAAALLTACLGGCAATRPHSGNDPLDGSGSTIPNIDYQGFPYNVRAA
jgi:hypothetical protein